MIRTTGLLLVAALTGCAGLSPMMGEKGAAGPTSGEGVYQCGNLEAHFEADGEKAWLSVAKERWQMTPVASASGARYEAVDDPETSFWNKGGRAQLVLEGEPRPECLMAGYLTSPFEAHGNEPFWHLTLDSGRWTLEVPDSGPVGGAMNWTTRSPELTEAEGRIGGLPASVRVEHRLCRDSMSGMPYPRRVTLNYDGKTLRGCGGEPSRLLRGGPWTVESLEDAGLIDGSRLTAYFMEDGRLTGRGGCNRYMAVYELDGEGVRIRRPASTLMACAPALMDQERRFLEQMTEVDHFNVDANGFLELLDGGETVVRMRPPE